MALPACSVFGWPGASDDRIPDLHSVPFDDMFIFILCGRGGVVDMICMFGSFYVMISMDYLL